MAMPQGPELLFDTAPGNQFKVMSPVKIFMDLWVLINLILFKQK